MKVIKWIGVALVIVIANIVGKIAGHSAGKATAQSPMEKQRFYAITKSRNQKTGYSTVAIVLTDDKKDCEPLLAGIRKGASSSNNPMTIESEQCASEISGDWLLAFNNKPINGAYYVAYTHNAWPFRQLFFDIDPGIPSSEVCAAMVNIYKSIYSNVQCVPPP
jgi:hypothetical protein